MERMAKFLLGTRQPFEHGYWRKVAYIKRQLRKIALSIIAIIVALVCMIAATLSWLNSGGHYEPDGYDIHGNLVDTDGDGDYYHWVD